MPQPREVDQLAAELIAVYQTMQSRIDAELAALAGDPAREARIRRLTELSKRIDQMVFEVDQTAEMLVDDTVERIYRLGGTHAQYRVAQIVSDQGGVVTGDLNGFNQISREAVVAMSEELSSELLAATSLVSESTKQMVRSIGRESVLEGIIGGKSVEQQSRAMTEWLEGNGIYGVKYRNGARVDIGSYAQMAIRTQSAKAYNAGIFDSASQVGVVYWEVFDGTGCGWTDHEDPSKANGSFRTESECREWPVSHPNCRRSFGPRPDLVPDNAKESTEYAADYFGIERTKVGRGKPFGWQPEDIKTGQQAASSAKKTAHQKALDRRQAALDKRRQQ